jgi:uncharacterized membrane protein YdfJ with MMPL/SSD domain
MNQQISSQASKLWQTLSAPHTVENYKQALAVTWNILKEAGVLIWLVFCLFLVAIDWFWTFSINAGRNFRTWINSFDNESDSSQIASQVGKNLLGSSSAAMQYAVTQARQQLGLPAKPESDAIAAIPSRSSSTVHVSPVPKPTPTPVAEAKEPTTSES